MHALKEALCMLLVLFDGTRMPGTVGCNHNVRTLTTNERTVEMLGDMRVISRRSSCIVTSGPVSLMVSVLLLSTSSLRSCSSHRSTTTRSRTTSTTELCQNGGHQSRRAGDQPCFSHTIYSFQTYYLLQWRVSLDAATIYSYTSHHYF